MPEIDPTLPSKVARQGSQEPQRAGGEQSSKLPLTEPKTKKVTLPEMGLVLLVGVSGSGKSTFAAKHFKPTQVISSDYCRALVADDENDQSATPDAFDVLHYIVGTRLRRGLLTVVDATNLQKSARESLLKVAKDNDVLTDAIVLDIPPQEAIARLRQRAEVTDTVVEQRATSERPPLSIAPVSESNSVVEQDAQHPTVETTSAPKQSPKSIIDRQYRDLSYTLKTIRKEGFRRVYVLKGDAEINTAQILYQKSWNDKKDLHGPFDIIGDVHGCLTELVELLEKLGYVIEYANSNTKQPINAIHPAGRTAIFVGDLVDRGPDTPGVLRLVMGMVAAGSALCVTGNHEAKLLRALKGAQVQISHGLAESLAQIAQETQNDPDFQAAVIEFLDGLHAHYVLDNGNLVVAHAGLKESYHGRASSRVKSFALYGDTTGESDEYGLPIRLPWANDYRGKAMVVYGHTPVLEPEWVNNTICVDTGVAFGGKLTALRYPERELVSVPARREYYKPARPLGERAYLPAELPEIITTKPPAVGVQPNPTNDATTNSINTPPREPMGLNITDVAGTHWLEANSYSIPGEAPQSPRPLRVKIPEENAAAALEIMSRFAVDPRWLVYLPPTMSPAPALPANALGDQDNQFLEYPEMAFQEYAAAGVTEVVCEEKHMGSRAIAVVARNSEVAAQQFAITDGTSGVVYTRTGREFFSGKLGQQLVAKVQNAVQPLFDKLNADWLVLDSELLPWSVKALGLIKDQYAAVGAAANAAFPPAINLLDKAIERLSSSNSAGETNGGAAGEATTELVNLRARLAHRFENASAYRDAYAAYAQPSNGLTGITLAPFQILAAGNSGIANNAAANALVPARNESESGKWAELFGQTKSHRWHLEQISALSDPFITKTRHIYVNLSDPAQRQQATNWWLELTQNGGEGMVVKPLAFTPESTSMAAEINPTIEQPNNHDNPNNQIVNKQHNRRKPVQPGLKVRGREYLRIIYGPDYLDNLKNLRNRALDRKKSLAIRENALGMTALVLFVKGAPLWQVHQQVFGVLALESEAVDPRL